MYEKNPPKIVINLPEHLLSESDTYCPRRFGLRVGGQESDALSPESFTYDGPAVESFVSEDPEGRPPLAFLNRRAPAPVKSYEDIVVRVRVTYEDAVVFRRKKCAMKYHPTFRVRGKAEFFACDLMDAVRQYWCACRQAPHGGRRHAAH